MNKATRAQNQSFSSFLPLAEDYMTGSDNKPKAVRSSDNLFTLQNVVGQTNYNYLTYNGSLTTPECKIFIIKYIFEYNILQISIYRLWNSYVDSSLQQKAINHPKGNESI